jgi:hypothetical protein
MEVVLTSLHQHGGSLNNKDMNIVAATANGLKYEAAEKGETPVAPRIEQVLWTAEMITNKYKTDDGPDKEEERDAGMFGYPSIGFEDGTDMKDAGSETSEKVVGATDTATGLSDLRKQADEFEKESKERIKKRGLRRRQK